MSMGGGYVRRYCWRRGGADPGSHFAFALSRTHPQDLAAVGRCPRAVRHCGLDRPAGLALVPGLPSARLSRQRAFVEAPKPRSEDLASRRPSFQERMLAPHSSVAPLPPIEIFFSVGFN